VTHLLDVNVLVALFDPSHIHHEVAHGWFGENRDHGWATCPITENGFLRVVTNPAYPGRRTSVADAAERFRRFLESRHHTFWPDAVSLVDSERVALAHVTGHNELTDTYLLALTVRHHGRLVTFDRRLRIRAVNGATASHVSVLPAVG